MLSGRHSWQYKCGTIPFFCCFCALQIGCHWCECVTIFAHHTITIVIILFWFIWSHRPVNNKCAPLFFLLQNEKFRQLFNDKKGQKLTWFQQFAKKQFTECTKSDVFSKILKVIKNAAATTILQRIDTESNQSCVKQKRERINQHKWATMLFWDSDANQAMK